MPSNDNKFVRVLVVAFVALVMGKMIYNRIALREAYETIGFVEAFFGDEVSCSGSYVYQLDDTRSCKRVRFSDTEFCNYSFRRGDYLKLSVSRKDPSVRIITYVSDNLETIRDMTARICPGGVRD